MLTNASSSELTASSVLQLIEFEARAEGADFLGHGR
jgi:hypothetical protein